MTAVYEFEINPIAPVGYEPDPRKWWQKARDFLLRRQYVPAPIYPAGAQSVLLETEHGRVYMPAAFITQKDSGGWRELGYTTEEGITASAGFSQSMEFTFLSEINYDVLDEVFGKGCRQ